MSSHKSSLIAAAVLLVAAAPLTAQSRAALAPPGGAPARVSVRIVPPKLAEARRLAEAGQFREARKTYQQLADTQRELGVYAADALSGVANISYALNDVGATARALDALADEAATFGDPETRLRALFESSLMYQQLGDKRRVADRLRVIRPLLRSPAIAEAVRNDYAERIVASTR